MIEIKRCSCCAQEKFLKMDFYLCMGIYRSECKKCTIIRNKSRPKKIKSWDKICIERHEKKLYMRKYYQDNKDKFVKYRVNFRNKHPEYYKEYIRKDINNNNKNWGPLTTPKTTN